MTTTMSTRSSRTSHPPQHPALQHRLPVRVGVLDRLALRLGLLLITYGRRDRSLSREQQLARFEQQHHSEQRQREATRRLLQLTLPR